MRGMVYANLDVAMIRDPKVLAAGYAARMLYVQIVLYCRENLTDGYLDEMLVKHVAADVPKPRLQLARLVEVGLLEQVSNGWAIPSQVWRNWNPTRSEVEAKRQTEALRKQAYRETVRNLSAGTGARENISRGQEEEEAKAEEKSSSSHVTIRREVDPFPMTTTLEQRVADAVELHARESAKDAKRPRAYAATVRNNTMIEHGAALTEYARKHPDVDASGLVAVVIHGQTERKQAWYADPHCVVCDGTGLRVVPDGGAGTGFPCECRRPEPYLATVTQLGVAR